MTINLSEEKKLWKQGYKFVIGLDEAGRGPLAGPVVAAAVLITPTLIAPTIKKHFEAPTIKKHSDILQNVRMFSGMRDSKKLSEKQREYFYEKLTNHSEIRWGVGMVSEKVIDRINILEATKLAMKKSVKDLRCNPPGSPPAGVQKIKDSRIRNEFLLIDGNFRLNNVKIPQKSIIKGDEKVFSITAAGIIAKVARDKIMGKMHERYPQYGFYSHKGYGTALHISNLHRFGHCPIHRKTFFPVSGVAKRESV